MIPYVVCIMEYICISNLLCGILSLELTPIGNFVVSISHDAKSNPYLLVCLGVVWAHLGPPSCKKASGHLWRQQQQSIKTVVRPVQMLQHQITVSFSRGMTARKTTPNSINNSTNLLKCCF